MSKYQYAATESRIARRLAAGRGSGEGASYQPFLKTRDVSSNGRRSRILGSKSGRVHHFLSDLEVRAFYELEWDDTVVDIRERFPLPREITRRIARAIGIRHPRTKPNGAACVLMTDLVVDRVHHNGLLRNAIFVVYEADLANPKAQEKLEIERRYWALYNVDVTVWTEKRLPKERGDNLQWLHAMHSVDASPYSDQTYWRERGADLVALLRRCPPQCSIADTIDRAETAGGYETGEVLSLIRYLGWRKIVTIDLDRRFDVRDRVTTLGLST